MHVHYRPQEQVLDHLNQVDFVGVVGPTAVGKTTIISRAAAADPRLHMVVFTTSRMPRPGEKNGIEYHFHTKKDMEGRISAGEYVNVAPTILGDLYASAPEDYQSNGVSVAAILADAVPTFRALPFKSCRIICIAPPSWEAWQGRIAAHAFPAPALRKRYSEAQQSFQFALEDPDALLLINDNLDRAVVDFIDLATGQKSHVDTSVNQESARNSVRSLLDRLNHEATAE